jgi:predicted dehydrogenase
MSDASTTDGSRRGFLKAAAAGAALSTFPALQARGANETLNVGLIGFGGRCRALTSALVKVPGVRIAAVCDVYAPNLDAGLKIADEKAFASADHKAILDRKDIDAVLIATPDHWHTPITIDACAAGKDVYVEKPLTHDLAEGKAVVEAQDKYKRVVQVGTQQRSMPQFQKGLELVKSGALGPIRKVHLTWNRNQDRIRRGPQGVEAARLDWKRFLGNAPEQPFDDYRYRNWRWFWDFGGGIFTDLMVHHIDIAHWFLGLDHPTLATSIGTSNISAGIWETPDTVQTLMVYPGGLQAHFEGTFSNAREGEHIVFMGTNASLYLDRGRLELTPERGKGEVEELVIGSGPKGRDFYEQPDGELLHLLNWVECIRSRARPVAPAEAGVSAASAAHLANRALRSGKVAAWRES